MSRKRKYKAALESLCRAATIGRTNELGEEYYECVECGMTDFVEVWHSDSCPFAVLNEAGPQQHAPQPGHDK